MDPWTLAYLAGHRDMNIAKRYMHPQEQTIRRRWIGDEESIESEDPSGAPGETRTPDLLVRSR